MSSVTGKGGGEGRRLASGSGGAGERFGSVGSRRAEAERGGGCGGLRRRRPYRWVGPGLPCGGGAGGEGQNQAAPVGPEHPRGGSGACGGSWLASPLAQGPAEPVLAVAAGSAASLGLLVPAVYVLRWALSPATNLTVILRPVTRRSLSWD